MKTPISLSRLAAIFATILVVALGLCGAQAGAWFGISSLGHASRSIESLTKVFIVTGYLELIAMAVSVGALLVIGALILGDRLFRNS